MNRRQFLLGSAGALTTAALGGASALAQSMGGNMPMSGNSPSTKDKGILVPVLYKDIKENPKQKWAIDVKPTTFKVGQAYTFQIKDDASGKHEFMIVDSKADAAFLAMNKSMVDMPGMSMSMDDMDKMPGVLAVIESDDLLHNGKPANVSVIFKSAGIYWAGCYMMDPVKNGASQVVGYVDHNALGMRAKITVVAA